MTCSERNVWMTRFSWTENGKLMLHLLRSKHRKVHLVEELRLRGVTDAYVTTRWDKLCKMMKAATKDDKG
jgi:hypothetical protein